MVILLTILWVGVILVIWPARFLDTLQTGHRSRLAEGLMVSNDLLYGPIAAVSAWFWIRLASHGEIDFSSSPGGSLFFFMGQLNIDKYRIASRFIAALVIYINAWGFMFSMIRKSTSQSIHFVAILISPAGIYLTLRALFLIIYAVAWYIICVLVSVTTCGHVQIPKPSSTWRDTWFFGIPELMW